MAIWVTSDFHFNHKNVINMGRKFDTIEQHNNYIVDQFNSVVGKDDLVYVLGDVGFTPLKDVKTWVSRLNGRKVLILGNHDKGRIGEYRSMGFIEVLTHPFYYSDQIILSHLPLRECLNNPYCINVHGHLHFNYLELPNFFNCNIDMNNYKPVNIKVYEELARKYCKENNKEKRFETFGQEWYYNYYHIKKQK